MKGHITSKSLAMGGAMILWSNLAFAKDMETTLTSTQLIQTLIYVMIAIGLVAVLLAWTILTLVRAKYMEDIAAKEGISVAEVRERTWAKVKILKWSFWNKQLNDAVPLEQEESIDMGHEYDGIRELDNNLPPWWKYGFYVSIAFAFVYLIHFHVAEISVLDVVFGEQQSSQEEFAIAMEEAEVVHQLYLEKMANMVNETSVTMLTAKTDISKGASIYKSNNCQSCHGQSGEGGIGPNLTDPYWKHGGEIKDVFASIKYGIPATAMKSWQKEIKPKEMQELSSYIMSLQGTNPPNGKAPEGKMFSIVPADSLSHTTQEDTTSLALN